MLPIEALPLKGADLPERPMTLTVPGAHGAAAVPRAVLRHLGRWTHGLLDVLYPPHCLSCRRAVGMRNALCPPCWRALSFIAPPVCDRLGTPFEVDLGTSGAGQILLSPEAMAHPPVYRRARAAVRFDDGPARRLVHQLKYGDRPEYGRPMGVWMAQAGAVLLAEADVIVPVPLHPRRLLQRRFNQAAVLAQSIGRVATKRVDLDALIRSKATKTQVGMSRSERADNIQGAFKITAAGAARLQGRTVLLVDDVLTTGATVNAAARVLLRSGAAAVDVLVFARVVTGS